MLLRSTMQLGFCRFLGGCTQKTRRVFGYVPGYPNPGCIPHDSVSTNVVYNM